MSEPETTFFPGFVCLFRRLPTFENISFSRNDNDHTSNCGWAVSKLIGIVLFQIIGSLLILVEKVPKGILF